MFYSMFQNYLQLIFRSIVFNVAVNAYSPQRLTIDCVRSARLIQRQNTITFIDLSFEMTAPRLMNVQIFISQRPQ